MCSSFDVARITFIKQFHYHFFFCIHEQLKTVIFSSLSMEYTRRVALFDYLYGPVGIDYSSDIPK